MATPLTTHHSQRTDAMRPQTARKGAVVLVSYAVLEGKPLTGVHALGACLFTGSVALNVTYGKKRKTQARLAQEASMASGAMAATEEEDPRTSTCDPATEPLVVRRV